MEDSGILSNFAAMKFLIPVFIAAASALPSMAAEKSDGKVEFSFGEKVNLAEAITGAENSEKRNESTPAEVGKVAGSSEKITVTPVGTLLLDGALYATPQKSEFPDGVAIPDVRLGVTARMGKWSAKIEAGFAYGKVLLKDIWMQYDFSKTDFVRVGLQMQQFGYQNSQAACQKVTMIEPMSNTVFNEPHMIGVTWFHSADKFFTTLSAHAEPKASTVVLAADEMTREGYGLRTRLVARPLHKDGIMVQAGISGGFETPQFNGGSGKKDTHDSFSLGSNFPTKVVQESAIKATVSDAMNLWKFTPELMLCYKRIALESQYFYAQVNRRNSLQAFRGQGAYATLRGVLLGKDYSYSMNVAGIATPGKGTLEGVASYNYTTLSDRKAGIFGGRVNDLTVGFNYYINKWMVAKIRYTSTHVWDRADTPAKTLNAFQARLQLIF